MQERTAGPRIEYKLVSTYIGYYCTSMSLHNILGGFKINLQAFQATLSLCTRTLFILFIVGPTILEFVLLGATFLPLHSCGNMYSCGKL